MSGHTGALLNAYLVMSCPFLKRKVLTSEGFFDMTANCMYCSLSFPDAAAKVGDLVGISDG
eukprot:1147091-Pelagomonas_calceolata.AAC.4